MHLVVGEFLVAGAFSVFREAQSRIIFCLGFSSALRLCKLVLALILLSIVLRITLLGYPRLLLPLLCMLPFEALSISL